MAVNTHPVQPFLYKTRFGWRWEILTYGLSRYKPSMNGWRRKEEKARADIAYWLPVLRAEFDTSTSRAKAEKDHAQRLAWGEEAPRG